MKPCNNLIEDIDAILPQTQCGDCGYQGCRPYATAIVNANEEIDRCLPGGVKVLKELASLLNRVATPLIPAMELKQKPSQLAVIAENLCIGCTKCITACPVDAIIGAPKQMHAIITDECTGCELCVEPCPMDCISIIPLAAKSVQSSETQEKSRQRYYAKQLRAQSKKKENNPVLPIIDAKQIEKKSYIEAALMRNKQKKQCNV